MGYINRYVFVYILCYYRAWQIGFWSGLPSGAYEPVIRIQEVCNDNEARNETFGVS